jgi:hypothetical protein
MRHLIVAFEGGGVDFVAVAAVAAVELQTMKLPSKKSVPACTHGSSPAIRAT